MMDLIPPSYKSATDRDAWAIIAHYIPSSDLCAASLVCHRWHDLFMPFLWGDPASHFGTENDAYARREVRALTHTLHLPPALSEIYGGPRPGWLRDILEYLPCLQCLMVSRLPFFDHNAMVALTNHPRSSEYNIRLLIADHEPNTTSASLAETILCFPRLTYLDLSFTRSARDQGVLSSLSLLEHLQVLKLRGIGLKDNDAEFLANAIGTRTRFLDVRNNLLTDMAVRSLLQASFTPPDQPNESSARHSGTSPDRTLPAARDHRRSEFLKSPDLDERYLKLLAQPGSYHPWIEDIPHTGITHLYIANNPITVEGVAGLLASSRLHALDVGTVNTADVIHKTASRRGIYPGAEKLVPILGNIAGEKLTYFRAHHAVVTAEPPAKDYIPKGEYLPELPSSNEVRREAELDASQEVYEMPAENTPVFELADTSISDSKGSTVMTSVSRSLNPCEDEPLPTVRRGSVFAPEVVLDSRHDSNSALFNSSSSPLSCWQNDEGTLQSVSNLSVQDDGTRGPIPRCSSPGSMDDPRAQRIRELLAKRPRNQSLPLRDGKESRYPYLHPSHIPHLETLVLTDVPSHIPPNSTILHALTRFITACSNEALLATLQAGSDYSLPPGQARMQAEQQRSRTLFGLRRLVLEVTPTNSKTRLTAWKPGVQNSSTGDRDSEALWAAAADDFSFFDDMECGIPENDPGKYFPMAVLNEKVSLVPLDDDTSTYSGAESSLPSRRISQRSVTSAVRRTPSPSQPVAKESQATPVEEIDLVAELAAFRRAKKAEYEQVVRRERRRRSTNGTGLSSVPAATTPQLSMAQFVEGHWKGEIKIVRNPTSKMRSGMVDMYGNYFEKGYLYP
ncbi:hypothetical protein F1880_005240 [Penicillium rolfsii]|nr:hypothetical protein F1880_005240 [Penicillium rolfsii]